MRHHGEDRARVHLALPEGWMEVDPDGAVGYAAGDMLQLITVESWDDADGVRPTMSLSLAEPTGTHIATRVLEEARDYLVDLHVISIDGWTVRGGRSGRRLVMAHADGDGVVTTLAWVAGTAVGELVVTAHVESMQLHRHDRVFAEALASIELPDGSARGPGPREEPQDPPSPAELLDVAPPAPWHPIGSGAPAIVADPDSRIVVEASLATTNLRFDATLVGEQVTVTATASPRTIAPGPDGRRPEPRPHVTSFRIPATRLAHAIARWVGLGPAETTASEPLTLPLSLLMNRLVDPSVPPPEGADLTTWAQPWFLWTLRSSATDSGLVMVHTGGTGQCAVMEAADKQTTRFAPLSSYNVWLTLNWLVSESLTHR
jgi:hypothetical protein